MLLRFSSLILLISAVSCSPALSSRSTSGAPELSAQTFTQTTSKGLWLVEHFSPYCVHCRKFKPTWEKLVKDVHIGGEIPVKLGTVNCVLHGDLCDTNGVKGYPSLFMYEDGKKVGEFKKARELDLIKEYLKSFIHEAKPASPPPQAPPLRHDEDDDDPVIPPPAVPSLAPARHLDHFDHSSEDHINPPQKPNLVAQKPRQPPAPKFNPSINPSGIVTPLTSATLPSILSKGPAFIKFYAPWCGHCKKLAPTWSQLASKLKGQVSVAEVNCDDEGGLCKEWGVQGYPTLVWVPEGGNKDDKTEYTGGRKLDVMQEFVEKALNAGVQALEREEDLNGYIEKEDVVYLLLHQPHESAIIPQIRTASSPLLGSPPILSSSSPHLLRQFSISPSTPWALIALKDHDASLPTSIYAADASQGGKALSGGGGYEADKDNSVREWLMSHRLPTALELSQATFQRVMNAPQKPLVLIAAVDLSDASTHSKLMAHLTSLAKKWRLRTGGTGLASGREVVFSMMDRGKWGSWLGGMYGIKDSKGKKGGDEQSEWADVDVVIADHSRLIYYPTDSTSHPLASSFGEPAKLFKAIEEAASGVLVYKNSENFVERLARNLNVYLQSLESAVTTHPIRSFLFALAFIVLFIWGLARLLSGGPGGPGGRDEWREMKRGEGRLD